MEILNPAAARIEEQLARIVASPQFRESPRLQTFLQFVVALTLEGKADQIKESTISAEVFGRADMPDDSIVRSAARRLRARLDEYYRQGGVGDPLRIAIPKGSYVPEMEELPSLNSSQSVEKSNATAVLAGAAHVPVPEVALPAELKQGRRWLYAASIAFGIACVSLGGWSLRHSQPRQSPAARTATTVAARSTASHVPNPAAHDFLIKGRFDLQSVTADAVKRAEADFQRAIDLDPNYPEAYMGLAGAELAEARARGSIYRTEIERDSAAELSRRALQLDPNLPEAHAVLAKLAMQYDWDWSKAERELRLAVTGPPSATAELTYTSLLIFQGRFPEADQHLQRAQELDPFDTATMLSLSNAWYLEGRFAQAREISQRVLTMYPTLPDAQTAAASSYTWEGKPELALAALERIKKPSPSLPFLEAMARARAGQHEAALRLIRPYQERYPNTGVALQWIAKVYAMVGDEPNTIRWLERSADRREWQALTIAVNPAFAHFENSPGFRALKIRMGLVDAGLNRQNVATRD